MDRNLDTETFERLLKERSEEFKMFPAKRVWHSIYNNIHPGKKWPSIAMCITLIAILLLVGYLNTNNVDNNYNLAGKNTKPFNNTAVPAIASSSFYNPFLQAAPFDNEAPFSFSDFLKNNPVNILYKNSINDIDALHSTVALTSSEMPENGLAVKYKNSTAQNTIPAEVKPLPGNQQQPFTALTNSEAPSKLSANKPEYSVADNKEITTGIYNEDGSVVNNQIEPYNQKEQRHLIVETNSLLTLKSNVSDLPNNEKNIVNDKEGETFPLNKKDITPVKENILSDADKAWVENYALYNRPAPKKWAGKLGWQFYVTPSVVYRSLKNAIPENPDINKMVTQHPSIGLEIGAGLIYPVFKGVKIKTGLQVNFTRYNTQAFENSHPVATSITLDDGEGQFYQASRTTRYSNNEGITPVKLHNETYQISIPMGVDFKLAGNDNLQWNVGSTIQPSYVFGGKSYLLSSDKRNYIKETSLLNRFNLNAGFETFIIYKTNGFTFQLGPQFRKQIFTTSSRQYTLEEKLNNYGFKFGITKLIK